MITDVNAEVSELADEQDSGSCERYAREGSSPFFRIRKPGSDASGFLRTGSWPAHYRSVSGMAAIGI